MGRLGDLQVTFSLHVIKFATSIKFIKETVTLCYPCRYLTAKHPCRIQYDVDYVHVGYLKEIYRPNDFVVVCHIPELSEADLPTLSLKRK